MACCRGSVRGVTQVAQVSSFFSAKFNLRLLVFDRHFACPTRGMMQIDGPTSSATLFTAILSIVFGWWCSKYEKLIRTSKRDLWGLHVFLSKPSMPFWNYTWQGFCRFFDVCMEEDMWFHFCWWPRLRNLYRLYWNPTRKKLYPLKLPV